MSFEAMAWATKQTIPAMQKIVLLMLANRTNFDTGRCDPSFDRLASDCGMSARSVINQLQALENGGFIKIVKRRDGAVSLPNHYILCTEIDSVVVKDIHPGSEPRSLGVVNHVHPKQEVETGIKQKPKKAQTTIPEDFSISTRILKWAQEKGYENLQAHLDNFILCCKAKGYKYSDWDSAFQRAISCNWAKVQAKEKEAWERP